MEAQEYYEELKMNHPSHIFEGDDIIRAFDDGISEGWKQCREKRWKPSDEQIEAVEDAIEFLGCTKKVREDLKSLYEQLKKLMEE